jgi:hypothetical protein
MDILVFDMNEVITLVSQHDVKILKVDHCIVIILINIITEKKPIIGMLLVIDK